MKIDHSKDYYAILGVLPSIEPVALRAVYLALLKKYHPDVFNGDKLEAERLTKDINESYEVLGDEKKKKHYDELRRNRTPSEVDQNKDKPKSKSKEAEKFLEAFLILETTKGKVVIKFRPDLAPNHVAHIKRLTGEGFYDGIVFHRVIDGFMAQTGCPHGTGTGGSSYPNLKQEFNPEPHVRGTCSMARAANPDSANSQFFICFDDARFLDRQYTVWGEVVEGMDNVDKIKRGEPVRDPDSIIRARITNLSF